jgi:hypothetical protein
MFLLHEYHITCDMPHLKSLHFTLASRLDTAFRFLDIVTTSTMGNRQMRYLLAFIVWTAISLATPLRVSRPLWIDEKAQNLSLKRSTSQDASCPTGFLCIQDTCPGGVVCPPGLDCINFEGTSACVPQGTTWCALNPDSYEAVGCVNGGTCW